MSSCTSVAVCTISTTAPSRMAPWPAVAQHVRGQQQQRRAYPLAPAFAQVFGDLRDGAYAGGGVAAQLLLDRHEVVPQQIEDLSRRRYRQCAQSSPVLAILGADARRVPVLRLGCGSTPPQFVR